MLNGTNIVYVSNGNGHFRHFSLFILIIMLLQIRHKTKAYSVNRLGIS